MATERERCSGLNEEYRQCLGKSNRNPGKCANKEADLRKCSKSTGQNFCIDETVNLMNCAKSPSRDFCANEFVSMRECNRPLGPQLVHVNEEGGYNIVEAAKIYFTAEAPEMLRALPPRDTSTAGLQSAARSYAEKLGLGGLENIRF